MSNHRQRLAKAVKARRVALGMNSQAELATSSGVSTRTIGSLERGEKISDNKMRALEIALRWPAYSFDAVLAGGPTPFDAAAVNPPALGPLAEILGASEEELDKMERLFDKFRPAQAREWRAWADGVRALHSEEQNSVPPRQGDRDAG